MNFSKKCICGYEIRTEDRSTYFINGSLKAQYDENGIEKRNYFMPFSDLFVNKAEATETCSRCNLKKDMTEISNFDIPEFNKFLIIRINNYRYDQCTRSQVKLNAKLDEYNENYLIIPNRNNYTYRILSAIMYYGDGNAGHYVVWKRSGSGWLRISDDKAVFHQNLIQNLKNVYLLFLEKNKTEIR